MRIGMTLRVAAAATGIIALLGLGAPAFAQQTTTGQPPAADTTKPAMQTTKPAMKTKHHAGMKHYGRHATKSMHRTYRAQSKSPASTQQGAGGGLKNPGGSAPNKANPNNP